MAIQLHGRVLIQGDFLNVKMQKLNTNQISYKSPRINNLLDLIVNGVDPECLPLDSLEVSTFQRAGVRSFLGYYYDQNNHRLQYVCKSQNRLEAVKLFKSFLLNKVKLLCKEAGLLVQHEYTISKLKTDFIKHKKGLNRDSDTIKEYESICEYLINTFGDITLSSLDLNKAQTIVTDGWVVQNKIRKSGQAPATKAKFVRHCKALFNYATTFHSKHLSENVWTCVELPTIITQSKTPLSLHQIKLLLDHIGRETVAKRNLSRILILSILLGTRIDELLHTKVAWLDRDNKFLNINNFDDFRIKERKDKFIDVDDFFMVIWDEQLADNMSQGLQSEFLFAHHTLGTISYNTIQKQLLRALKAIGVYRKGMGFHVNRAAFGVSMSDKGASVRDIQKYYGHSSVKVTEKYLNKSDDRSKRAKKAIAKHSKAVSNILGYSSATQNFPKSEEVFDLSNKEIIPAKIQAYLIARSNFNIA